MNFIDSPMNNLNVITSNLGPGSIFVPFVKKTQGLTMQILKSGPISTRTMQDV